MAAASASIIAALAVPWLWQPITVAAALAQTLRNAAQRHLTGDLGALGATLVRFLYGLPFALLWLLLLRGLTADEPLPALGLRFFLWTALGGIAQIAATAALLRVMAERNFALGVAYSKTEVIQVAIIGAVLLADPLSLAGLAAILVATAGVVLLSLPKGSRSLGAIAAGWTSRPALLGLASGTGFAISAAGFRGAALSLGIEAASAAAYTLAFAQLIQTVALGGWLLLRQRRVIIAVLRAWRVSLLAGFMGALASMLWFTAMAMEPVAHVRTLGLVELLFSYVVSARVFRERLSLMEVAGFVLLGLGLVGILRLN
jgi:drug/metabolite transporter (DMT)-like permease